MWKYTEHKTAGWFFHSIIIIIIYHQVSKESISLIKSNHQKIMMMIEIENWIYLIIIIIFLSLFLWFLFSSSPIIHPTSSKLTSSFLFIIMIFFYHHHRIQFNSNSISTTIIIYQIDKNNYWSIFFTKKNIIQGLTIELYVVMCKFLFQFWCNSCWNKNCFRFWQSSLSVFFLCETKPEKKCNTYLNEIFLKKTSVLKREIKKRISQMNNI